MIKIINFAILIGLSGIFCTNAQAVGDDDGVPEQSSGRDSVDSLSDAEVAAFARCPRCKRIFMRDHKLTDERYAELLQDRAKGQALGPNGTTTGQ